MRPLSIFYLLLFYSFIAFGQQKPRIAVYMTGDDPINEIVANRLMESLLYTNKYLPLERSDAFLEAVSKEHTFERNGTVDDDEIARLGKQFGLQYVCVVSIFNVWQNEKYISVHVIDVTSTEVIGSFSSNGTLSSPDMLMDALEDLTYKLNGIFEYKKRETAAKVAVYVTRTGNKDVDIILGNQLVAGFAKSHNYIAVERTNAFLKQINKELEYEQSGTVDDNEHLAEIGKRFGVQCVCVVKTTFWEGAYFISTRLINVETATSLNMYNAENIVLNNSQDVIKLSESIVKRLTDRDFSDDGYYMIEENAEFPGGNDACYEFLRENLRYPEKAQEMGIQGEVIVDFTVDKDGSITNIKIVRDFDVQKKRIGKTKVVEVTEGGVFADEVIRLLKLMPKWKPARQGNHAVRSHFTLPINFSLL